MIPLGRFEKNPDAYLRDVRGGSEGDDGGGGLGGRGRMG